MRLVWEMYMVRKARDESTPEGAAIWRDVDKAAARAPEWIKRRIVSDRVKVPLERVVCVRANGIVAEFEPRPYDGNDLALLVRSHDVAALEAAYAKALADLEHERSVWCDKPDDRLYHAADGTWWRREVQWDGTYRCVAAEAPAEVERLRAALQRELDELRARMKDRTHWEGCEEAHPMCAALTRIESALVAEKLGEGS